MVPGLGRAWGVEHGPLPHGLRTRFRRAMAGLPPRQAEAFRRFWEGFEFRERPPSAAQLAEAMGISPRTVEGHLYRARRHLRKEMAA